MPTQETTPRSAAPEGTLEVPTRSALERLLHASPMPASRLAWAGALAIFALALVLRLWGLGAIQELIFDETYYVKDGYTLTQTGVERNWPEEPDEAFESGDVDSFLQDPAYVVHPSLGKWVIGAGMMILGPESAWGWRISVAVLGSLSVLMLTRITRRLLRSTGLGLIAGGLLAIDGLHLTHSRTSLLDLILMVFVLAAFGALLIDRDRFRRRLAEVTARSIDGAQQLSALGISGGLRPWRLTAGVLLGLSCSVKWSGLYFLAVFGIMTVLWDWWARRRIREKHWPTNGLFKDAIPAFFAMVGTSLLVYVGSWAGWFASSDGYFRRWAEENGHEDGNPVANALRSLWHYHQEAYSFHVGLHSEHTYQANPFGWLLQIRPTNFYYRSYDYGEAGCQVEKCAAQILSVGNPLIWWLGTLAILVTLVTAILWRDGRAWAALSGIIGGYLPWFMYLDRTIFTFYAIAFEPWVIICLVYVMGLVIGGRGADSERRLAGTLFVGSVLTLIVLVSAFFWPIWTGQVIDLEQWHWRMWLPSWP